jgi:DNA-binding transcriptional MerR regulator
LPGTDESARLSISVFGRRSRLSQKALRLYDRLGLLTPAEVDPHSGYRWYHESQLPTARLVAMLRRLDMPLVQIGEVISAPGPEAATLISDYWDAAERRLAAQRELVAHLRLTLTGGDGLLGRFAIRQRDVPAQVVLTERRHVTVAELSGWIESTMARLVARAAEYGGVAGPTFVIYRGEVNEDSDGPAECCVPVDVSTPPEGARIEPAHHEAYTRLVRATVEYPQILSAYDAVAAWASTHGHAITDAPREVYFADFDSARPTDEVCDVAFPVSG